MHSTADIIQDIISIVSQNLNINHLSLDNNNGDGDYEINLPIELDIHQSTNIENMLTEKFVIKRFEVSTAHIFIKDII